MAVDRLRVASLQYFIRPIATFEQFRDQVCGLLETPADYRCRLVVFPEYFTVQLLCLGDLRRPMRAQIRDLARQVPQYLELMAGQARRHGLHIVAGTIPVGEEGSDQVTNRCHFFTPSGACGMQGKLHMTRFEREEWDVAPESTLRLFETEFGRVAIAICYDVQFPEIAPPRPASGRTF